MQNKSYYAGLHVNILEPDRAWCLQTIYAVVVYNFVCASHILCLENYILQSLEQLRSIGIHQIRRRNIAAERILKNTIQTTVLSNSEISDTVRIR